MNIVDNTNNRINEDTISFILIEVHDLKYRFRAIVESIRNSLFVSIFALKRLSNIVIFVFC